jgi:hypothetical protein
MGPGAQLFAAIVAAVVIFRGTLSLLPERFARQYDGSLSGLGFWIPAMVTIGALAGIYNAVAKSRRGGGSDT